MPQHTQIQGCTSVEIEQAGKIRGNDVLIIHAMVE